MENDFIKNLLENKKIFEKGKGYGDYSKPVMDEVYKYQKQFRIENNRPVGTIYNNELENYVIEKENIPVELQEYIKVEVYLSQQKEHKEDKEKNVENMKNQGWLVLDRDVKYRGKIKFIGSVVQDWFTSKIEKEGKLIDGDEGRAFIIPKGKRSRGYYVALLENAFYKQLS
jgi:hypothetical protein